MTRRIRQSSGRIGFTLVEVLATLVLVAVILPVAMRAFSIALSAASESRHRMEAAALAENEIAELIATQSWQSADLSGDCGEDWPAYTWKAEVTDWDGATLRELAVTVNWTAAARERGVTMTTLVYEGGS